MYEVVAHSRASQPVQQAFTQGTHSPDAPLCIRISRFPPTTSYFLLPISYFLLPHQMRDRSEFAMIEKYL